MLANTESPLDAYDGRRLSVNRNGGGFGSVRTMGIYLYGFVKTRTEGVEKKLTARSLLGFNGRPAIPSSIRLECHRICTRLRVVGLLGRAANRMLMSYLRRFRSSLWCRRLRQVNRLMAPNCRERRRRAVLT